MRILWCEEHGQAEDGEGLCHRGRVLSYRGTVLSPDKTRIDHFEVGSCRLVPMRLIPDNEETVNQRIAEVLDAWAPDLNDAAVALFTDEILNALRIQLDGETP